MWLPLLVAVSGPSREPGSTDGSEIFLPVSFWECWCEGKQKTAA